MMFNEMTANSNSCITLSPINGSAEKTHTVHPIKPILGSYQEKNDILLQSGCLPHKLESDPNLNQVFTRNLCVSIDSHSIGSAISKRDTGPSIGLSHTSSALCDSSLPDPSHDGHQHCVIAQISFNPIVRIIRSVDDDNSSDDDHLPDLNASHRTMKYIPSKCPMRLCTKKITLPLNISTSSLVGSHRNQSTSSLPSAFPLSPPSARQLIEQTRQEIEEDEQFIPDTPRHLNLILPRITRQPSRRTIRQQEERRLQRWKELFGGGKSNLKSSHYSHLYYLSADLRKLLNESSLPVQLSTNTAINSIHSSISPADLMVEQLKTSHHPEKNPNQLQKVQLDSSSPFSSSKPIDHDAAESQTAFVPNLMVDELSYSKPQAQPSYQQDLRKASRPGWLGAKLIFRWRSKHPANRRISQPDSPLESSSNRRHIIEGAPLARMSTPRNAANDPTSSGAPLTRASTPAVAIRKQSLFGFSSQRTTSPGAHVERQSTPGTPLKKFSKRNAPPSKTKPHGSSFLFKLIHWPPKPIPYIEDSTNIIPENDNPSQVNFDELVVNSQRPFMSNISPACFLVDSGQISLVDKWGNHSKVPLRQCCEACLNLAEAGKDPNHEIPLSAGARKQYYSISGFLEDVVKQEGIPAQHIKLLSKELGAPYDAWVDQVTES